MKTLREEVLRELEGLASIYRDAADMPDAVCGIHQTVASEVVSALADACVRLQYDSRDKWDNEITQVDLCPDEQEPEGSDGN